MPSITFSALAVLSVFLVLMGASCTPIIPTAPSASPTPVAQPTALPTTASIAAVPTLPATAAILPPVPAPAFLSPIAGGLSRVTKKPFGLHVTSKDSPVQPERFSGYHTGIDFETTLAEQDTEVVITAACDGTLLVRRTASGYGGVAVQSCRLDGRDVTVIYGHLRLASITAKIGADLKAGDRLGILGRGFSPETDGERKHLHLGIHVGSTVSLLGYVPTKAALVGWLDPAQQLNR